MPGVRRGRSYCFPRIRATPWRTRSATWLRSGATSVEREVDAEELWEKLGHSGSLAYEPFPEADASFLVEDQVEVAIQVMGKIRARISACLLYTSDAADE